MNKLGYFFRKALLVEDSVDICGLYRYFFESQQLDIRMTNLSDDLEISQYDILVCDWFVGPESAERCFNGV